MNEFVGSSLPATLAPERSTTKIDILAIEQSLAQIISLRDDQERLGALLDFLRALTNARAAILASLAEGEVRVLEQIWSDTTGAEMLTRSVAEILAKGPTQAAVLPLQALPRTYLLLSPVTRLDGSRLFVCLILGANHVRDLEPFLITLQTTIGFLHAAIDRRGGDAKEALTQAAALIELGTLTGAADGFKAAADILTGQLRRHLGCFWVCLGMAKGDQIRLASISGVGAFDAQGTATAAMEAAMREAILQRIPIDRSGSEETGPEEIAHEELRRELDLERVCTVPFFWEDGRPLGALTLIWEQVGPRYASTAWIEVAAPYLQSQLQVLKKSDPLALSRWRRGWKRLGAGRRWFLLGGLGALVAASFYPFPQHIHVACRVQPALKRVVAAPFDGTLKEVLVDPGQAVTAGTVLAVMDDKELRWKEADVEASRDRALTMRDKSMTDPDSSDALSQMAGLEAEGHALELKITQYQIAHLEVKSPIDGIVLTGDLKRAVGVPVSKGQLLFEVATLDSLIVELDIPEEDAPYVRDGMPATVRLGALPSREWETTLHKIDPQSEIRDGGNFFRAEADLPGAAETGQLRPGMKGKAVLIGAPQPLYWLLFHRFWGVVRLALYW